MRKVDMTTYLEEPSRYILRSGANHDDAPLCPYGNIQQWVGYDLKLEEYVRFTKSVFKLLVQEKDLE